MMAMRVRTIEHYHRQLACLHALDDLRMLDVLVASESHDAYTKVRERLFRVHEKGAAAVDAVTGKLILTEEEYKAERARARQFMQTI